METASSRRVVSGEEGFIGGHCTDVLQQFIAGVCINLKESQPAEGEQIALVQPSLLEKAIAEGRSSFLH